jgi:hypothetical protein
MKLFAQKIPSLHSAKNLTETMFFSSHVSYRRSLTFQPVLPRFTGKHSAAGIDLNRPSERIKSLAAGQISGQLSAIT